MTILHDSSNVNSDSSLLHFAKHLNQLCDLGDEISLLVQRHFHLWRYRRLSSEARYEISLCRVPPKPNLQRLLQVVGQRRGRNRAEIPHPQVAKPYHLLDVRGSDGRRGMAAWVLGVLAYYRFLCQCVELGLDESRPQGQGSRKLCAFGGEWEATAIDSGAVCQRHSSHKGVQLYLRCRNILLGGAGQR